MAHQVLARKWRPQIFAELTGQEHVVKALSNSLEQQRLHHAYLFSGTRGIGKTTVARILARCLNCETGITAAPCGQCASCTEISEGRSLDLIEVDAASRTKVDDTRELLENVPFAPTRSRYKIYLIDEVHMLSNSSFNALLKTIEEPPEHVVFLFATTHPQKIPATVLSRCLQFHLKNMSASDISTHLSKILSEESVTAEDDALLAIAAAAAGSMRDALSLTEQAIAFGDGVITRTQVEGMLGAVEATLLLDLLTAITAGNGADALQLIREYGKQAIDFGLLIDELLRLLHRIAVEQAAPGAGSVSNLDAQAIAQFAQQNSPEDIQLYYQTALGSKRDLPLAPDPLTGLEMLVLRLLAFRTMVQDNLQALALETKTAGPEEQTRKKPEARSAAFAERNQAAAIAAEKINTDVASEVTAEIPAKVAALETANKTVASPDLKPGLIAEQQNSLGASQLGAQDGFIDALNEAPNIDNLTPKIWCQIFSALPLSGVVRAIASHCVPLAVNGANVEFALRQDNATLYKSESAERLAKGLSIYYGRAVECVIKLVDDWTAAGLNEPVETPVIYRERKLEEKHSRALQELNNDQNVKTLLDTFDGSLDKTTIEFIDDQKELENK